MPIISDDFFKNDEDDKERKEDKVDEDDFKKAKLRNPKAFALQSYVAAERQFRRSFILKI